MDVSLSGKLFCTGARGGIIRVWDLAAKQEIASFRLEAAKGDTDPLRYVFATPSPDENVIAGCSSGTRDVVLWDIRTSSEVRRLKASGRVGLRELRFTPDGKFVFAGEGDANDRLSQLPGSAEGKLWIWDVATGEAESYQQHSDSIWSANVSPDGKRIVTASIDGSVKVFDLATTESTVLLPPSMTGMLQAGFSADGRWITAVPRLWATATFWDAATGERVKHMVFGDETINSQFSPDGKTVATGTSVDGRANSMVRYWDAESGASVGVAIPLHAPIGRLALSPDSKFIAIILTESVARDTAAPSNAFGSADVIVYEVATGREIVRLQGHSSAVGEMKSLEFSRDGSVLASAGYDRQVVLWDTRTWRQIAKLLGHTSQLNDLSFSADGQRLASSADDGWVRLWDLKTNREVARFRGSHVEFSPDGTTLAVGGSGGATLHTDHVLEADGSFGGFKEGSEFLSVRIYRAPHRDRTAEFPAGVASQ